jgi:hypothetical protein
MRVDAKRCTKCGEYKPLTEYPGDKLSPDGYRSACRVCFNLGARARNQQRYKEVREWLWAEKSKPCERCGNTYHPVAMQFDHLPGFKKRFNVTVGCAGTRSLALFKAERAKCQLLCANCHHIVTWERKTGETVPVE